VLGDKPVLEDQPEIIIENRNDGRYVHCAAEVDGDGQCSRTIDHVLVIFYAERHRLEFVPVL
jgi:hypothetical protein